MTITKSPPTTKRPESNQTQSPDVLKQYTAFDIGQMSYVDMRDLWRECRKNIFTELNKVGNSYTAIGKMFGLTRQQVSNVINNVITEK